MHGSKQKLLPWLTKKNQFTNHSRPEEFDELFWLRFLVSESPNLPIQSWKWRTCVIDGPVHFINSKQKSDQQIKVYLFLFPCLLWQRVNAQNVNFRNPLAAKLQNTRPLCSASLTCVGRLWRSRHNTIDAILIQWSAQLIKPHCRSLPVVGASTFFGRNLLRDVCSKRTRRQWSASATGKVPNTLWIQFLDRENNEKNNTLPLGKQICLKIVWGCAEILPVQLFIKAISDIFSKNA